MGKKIIFIDSECSLCNRFVDLVFKFDKKQEFSFYLLRGEEGELKTIVFFEDNKFYTRYSAISKVLKSTNLFFKVMFSIADILPESASNLVYDFVAKNRTKLFGRGYCTLIPANRKLSENDIGVEKSAQAKKLSLN